MKNPYFGRLLTAMVTSFNADGSVNYEKAADLAEWLINNGSDGLVVAGSTGGCYYECGGKTGIVPRSC